MARTRILETTGAQWRALVACLLVALLTEGLSGCAAFGRPLEEPELTLAGVRLLDAGLARQRFGLVFDVRNPNSIALPIRRVSYTVELSGAEFASGETPQSFSVPANGEARFEIDVSTDLMASSRQALALLRTQDRLDYALEGRLEVNLPFVRDIPFARNGTVSLQNLRL
ncbi:MAG: LEA type 2 family protein [Gammaproteobacteria bacterium]